MAENILIIKPSSIGDVVHALPVLARVRETFPNARISWLVEAGASALLEANPALDSLVCFRRRTGRLDKVLAAQYDLLRRLKHRRFDLVIDLQGLLRSAIWSRATGARRRIGLSDAREGARWFYTDVAAVNGAAHAVDRYLRVGSALGFGAGSPSFTLCAGEAARTCVERLLASLPGPPARPFFALCPGARWPSKNWPAESFAQAGNMLIERFGGTVFILGAPFAAEDAELIRARIGPRAVNLAGRTSLAELVPLVSRMDIVITPDTGTLHVADALGVPLVAIFGPTDPARTGPYRQRSRVLAARHVCAEAPCMRRGCASLRCMNAVTPRGVFELAAAVLEGKR